jgi:hypothetical protein
MPAINSILDHCVVEHEKDCLQSANELLKVIDAALSKFESAIYLSEKGEVRLPCFVCGRGAYVEETRNGKVRLDEFDSNTRPIGAIEVRVFSCNVCTHRAFFSLEFPDRFLRAEPPYLPNIPLANNLRSAYEAVYNSLSAGYQSTGDLIVLKALGPARHQVSALLTKDNMYKLSADTKTFEALVKQIDSTNKELRTLQIEIQSTASHFSNAVEILGTIARLFSIS